MSDDLKRRLHAHILAGGTPKEFACGNLIHSTAAGKLLAGLGIRKVFITRAEHALITQNRKTHQP
jgi:hypothetical protein